MLLEDGHAETAVFSFLRHAADRVGDRSVPDREIQGAIRSAQERMAGGVLDSPRWPPFNNALRNEIVAHAGVTMEQLGASSDSLPQDSWTYVSQLYRPDDFVCLGATAYEFGTRKRDDWQAWLASYAYEYINPQPMTAEFGLTKENKASAHCLDNCGPKVYQVIEFDFGAANEHAAILWHLAKTARLVLITYSGGKSLHGWYNVRGWTDASTLSFFRSAVELGADPKMWSRCQFSRLPAGWNTKTKRQQVVVVFEPKHL
jgi:hypothetical protein